MNILDLKTFKIDLATTELLAGKLRGSPCGAAPTILAGESLMRQNNIHMKVHELLGVTVAPAAKA